MALEFKTPEQAAEEYLTTLKALKPEVNTRQRDSDWWVRSRVTGGVLSGVYADQKRLADDAFPQLGRREAVEKHLNLWFGEGFRPATNSQGQAKITGSAGSTAPAGGLEFTYDPNGNKYQNTEEAEIGAAGSGVVDIRSVNTGQDQNLLEGAQLSISSPPGGFDDSAEVFGGDLGDGRNEETTEQGAQRVVDRVRSPIAGGNENDYVQFALDADDAVVTANVIRFFLGLGTVGVVITAGTTDIDQAIDNGTPIVQLPSDQLIEDVKRYIDALNPATDCVFVLKPVEVFIDVTARVRFIDGDLTTTPSGASLTHQQLIEREIKRAIYRTPIGGRKFGGAATGSVINAEIEENLDSRLSAEPYTIGQDFQVLADRQIDDLSATGANRSLAPFEIAVPGNLTVIEF